MCHRAFIEERGESVKSVAISTTVFPPITSFTEDDGDRVVAGGVPVRVFAPFAGRAAGPPAMAPGAGR